MLIFLKKKKKKKKRNKKKKTNTGESSEQQEKLDPSVNRGPCYKNGQKLSNSRFQDNTFIRKLGDWKEGEWKQTNPPTIPVEDQFPDAIYPKGLHMDYTRKECAHRTTQEELREKDKLSESALNDMRKAAECHRQVRKRC